MMIGDRVYIIPSRSLKFGGRWGDVVHISDRQSLPLLIQFDDSFVPFWFDYNEVVTKTQFYELLKKQVNCGSCGTDITGQFISTCEYCDLKHFEEDIATWQKSNK